MTYEVHGSDGLKLATSSVRHARRMCDGLMVSDARARVLRDGVVVYDPRDTRPKTAADPSADAVAIILRHAQNRCNTAGVPDIAIRPVVRGSSVEWWASIDVLTPTGSVEWMAASKGAKTADGALRQLAREIVTERRAEALCP